MSGCAVLTLACTGKSGVIWPCSEVTSIMTLGFQVLMAAKSL